MASTLDLPTRYFWRLVGRLVDIASEHAWLNSPTNTYGGIGDQWLDALDASGRVRDPSPDDGLLELCRRSTGPTSLLLTSILRCATSTNTPSHGA